MLPQKGAGELDLAAHRSTLEVLADPDVALSSQEANDSTAGKTHLKTSLETLGHTGSSSCRASTIGNSLTTARSPSARCAKSHPLQASHRSVR